MEGARVGAGARVGQVRLLIRIYSLSEREYVSHIRRSLYDWFRLSFHVVGVRYLVGRTDGRMHGRTDGCTDGPPSRSMNEEEKKAKQEAIKRLQVRAIS